MRDKQTRKIWEYGHCPEMIRPRDGVDKAGKKTKVAVVAPVALEGNIDFASRKKALLSEVIRNESTI